MGGVVSGYVSRLESRKGKGEEEDCPLNGCSKARPEDLCESHVNFNNGRTHRTDDELVHLCPTDQLG